MIMRDIPGTVKCPECGSENVGTKWSLTTIVAWVGRILGVPAVKIFELPLCDRYFIIPSAAYNIVRDVNKKRSSAALFAEERFLDCVKPEHIKLDYFAPTLICSSFTSWWLFARQSSTRFCALSPLY